MTANHSKTRHFVQFLNGLLSWTLLYIEEVYKNNIIWYKVVQASWNHSKTGQIVSFECI
jgi:predicted metallo-beta-lactamase superfamily hydrolase